MMNKCSELVLFFLIASMHQLLWKWKKNVILFSYKKFKQFVLSDINNRFHLKSKFTTYQQI